MAIFPLAMSANGKYLVDGNGNPYLLWGQSAWLLAAQIGSTAQNTYLTDLVSRGYNSVYVQLHARRCDHANDASANGNAPFTNTSTLALNSAYLTDLQTLAAACQSRGIALWFSFYFGYGGLGDDGYWDLYSAAGATNCQTMAAGIASALSAYPCVMYEVGGDYMPPSATIANAIYDGIRSINSTVLVTGYWGSAGGGTASTDLSAWWSHIGSSQRVCGVAAWNDPAAQVRGNYGGGAPVVFFEGAYEHNAVFGTDSQIRSTMRYNAAHTFLAGALGGGFAGNEYVWPFDSTDHPAQSGAPSGHSYTEYFGDTGILQIARFGALINGQPGWHLLVPDTLNQLVIAGNGSGSSLVGAALASDNTLAIFYAPTSANFTVDLSKMAGLFRIRWWNWTTGLFTTVGTNVVNTGTQIFSAPGHADGTDSVLVFDTPPVAPTAANLGLTAFGLLF